jgi:hypothetical protein
VVFDATGNLQAMERGLDFVANGGTYVLVSIVRDRIAFSDPEFHRRETSLLGSRNATPQDFETVMQAFPAGKVPSAALATHAAPLADLPSVLDGWLRSDAGVIRRSSACEAAGCDQKWAQQSRCVPQGAPGAFFVPAPDTRDCPNAEFQHVTSAGIAAHAKSNHRQPAPCTSWM